MPGRHAAVDLVGRNLDELAEARRVARGLEQDERAEDVGVDEIAGRQDRSIDVRLGREVHDDVRLLRTSGAATPASAMSPLTKRWRGLSITLAQVLEPAGVGQLVERRDAPVGMRAVRPADEIGPDESGAAGDENLYHRMPTSELSPSMNRYADGRTGRR